MIGVRQQLAKPVAGSALLGLFQNSRRRDYQKKVNYGYRICRCRERYLKIF